MTESEKRLIELCIKDGYGTAAFAMSVKQQGKCSERQFLTMQRLHSAADFRRNNRPRKSSRQNQLDYAFSDYADGGEF